MADFSRITNRFLIEARFVTQTAIAVGSRVSLLPAGSDLPVMKTPDGLPYIPGSSLKGVVRAYLERVLRTADDMGKKMQGERLWACDPLDKEACCVPPDKKKELHEKAEKEAKRNGKPLDATFSKFLWEKTCTACRLFGNQWIASRVAFQDAYLLNEDSLPLLVEVRDGVGIDRDLGAAKPGIKYDFETVPRGAVFGFRMILENVKEWEVGLFCLALDALRRGELAIGGKSTRGLGWGTFEELMIRSLSPEDLLFGREGTPRELSECISTFTEALG